MNNKIVLSMIFLLVVIALIIFGVDFYFYLKNRYCRFHIGRCTDFEKWKVSIKSVVHKWIKRTPTVKKTDNSRYMLFDMIDGNYRNKTIQSWQKAALILSLLESENEKDRELAKKVANSLIDEKGTWKESPVSVDCGMISYAVLKAADNPLRIKRAMDYSISIIVKNINDEGMISYTGGRDNPEMYVDTLGLACPFLVLYSAVYKKEEYSKIAYHQFEIFHRFGLYNDSALPNHAFNIHTKMPVGVYGWGRGVAWYVIGLLESYLGLEKDDFKEDFLVWIKEAAEKYKIYQQEDGGFGSTLQRMNTYDSSATAVLAWFYLLCSKIFNNQEYYNISEKCIKKLMKVTRITGKIDWCQGDTKAIGVFAQTYDIMPFAQGMALRAVHLIK